MQLQVGGDGQDPWASLISSYSLAKQFPSGEAAHQGSVSTLQRGRRAGPHYCDELGSRPQLPEGDEGAGSPKQLWRVSPWSGWVRSVWLSSGAVGAGHRSGRSGKEVTNIPGRREEAVAAASSEHMRKGRGLEQASHAGFSK